MLDVVNPNTGGPPPQRRAGWSDWLPGARSVAKIDGQRGIVLAEPVQADRYTAGVVVEPDPRAEQHRRNVQVDLVDQPQLEKLSSDGR